VSGSRYESNLERGTVTLAVLAVLAIVWRYMDALGDTFWYVAAGRWMLDTGRLPQTDPFTFTALGSPWIAWTPLSYVAFALIERHTGLFGLLVAASLVSALAHLLAWLPHSRGATRWLLLPLVLLVAFSQRDDACARGQVLADLCFALFLWALLRMGAGRTSELSRRQSVGLYVGLVLLGSVWMNSHQSGFVPLLLVPAYALGIAGEKTPRRTRLFHLAGALAALLYGALITPYGPRLFVEAMGHVAAPISETIDLFQSPDFARVDVLLIVGAAAAALATALRDERPGRRGEALLLVALLSASLTGRRYLPWLGFATIASLGRVDAAAVLPALVARQRHLRLAVATISIAVSAFGFSVSKNPLRDVPVGGVRAIDALGLPDRVYNTYHWGGYLLYVWGGSARTFIDGRLYPFDRNEVHRDAWHIHAVAADAGALLETYQINTVLTERGSPLHAALGRRRDWALRYEGPIEVVFVRRSPLPVE